MVYDGTCGVHPWVKKMAVAISNLFNIHGSFFLYSRIKISPISNCIKILWKLEQKSFLGQSGWYLLFLGQDHQISLDPKIQSNKKTGVQNLCYKKIWAC